MAQRWTGYKTNGLVPHWVTMVMENSAKLISIVANDMKTGIAYVLHRTRVHTYLNSNFQCIKILFEFHTFIRGDWTCVTSFISNFSLELFISVHHLKWLYSEMIRHKEPSVFHFTRCWCRLLHVATCLPVILCQRMWVHGTLQTQAKQRKQWWKYRVIKIWNMYKIWDVNCIAATGVRTANECCKIR